MNNMVIGQYVPMDSLIHRLDPRTKISIIFSFVVIVFFANNLPSYLILTGFALGSMFATKVPIRFVLKGLTPVWFLIIFTFFLHIIITKEDTVFLEIYLFKVIFKCLF